MRKITLPALLFLSFILSFSACRVEAPKFIARCDVHGGAAPPIGPQSGEYTARYFFLPGEVKSCDEAKSMPGVFSLTVVQGTGFQRHELNDNGVGYHPNPIAALKDDRGTTGYAHRLIDGKPSFINPEGHVCFAEKKRALNKPTGQDGPELLLSVVACTAPYFMVQ